MLRARFFGKYTDVGDIIEIDKGDGKGTVVIEATSDGRLVTITGQSEKGDIKVFTNSDGILVKIQVTGDYRTSDTTEYLHQRDGHLSEPKVIKNGMQW